MIGYCGGCDKQIEFNQRTVVKALDNEGKLYINIICPLCEDYEEVLLEEKYTISDLRKDVSIKTAPNHGLRQLRENNRVRKQQKVIEELNKHNEALIIENLTLKNLQI